MADEQVVEETAGEEEKSGGRLGLIITIVGILAAVGGGLGVYFFVIAPMFAVEGEMTGELDDGKEVIPLIPGNVVFDMATVNLMRDGDNAAATLIYKINFECSDDITVGLIETYKPRFIDMLGKLHDSRTRAEVDDILLFKESVQAQAMQKGNDLLQRLVPEEMDASMYRITAVLHEQCMAMDPP
jgi:flagellar basal body-associated protein FliL